MEKNYLTGRCPNCMQDLKVPEELKEFSCMYCGARLKQEELLTGEPMLADEAAYAAALERLAGCMRGYRGYHKRVTKEDYVPAFETYEAGCRETLRLLDSGVAGLDETARSAQLQKAADRLIDDLEQDWRKQGKLDRIAQENDKYVIALFFVPMTLKQKLPAGREFVDKLHSSWMARYPKSPFYVGDYETLVSGFQKKKFLGFCFITTAVCEAEGKPDDCAELTAFRAFRDGYLRAQPDGPALIEEYYATAPAIVMCIDVCCDREARYAAIRAQHLGPCYEALKSGDPEDCKRRYVRMMRCLQQEYLS